MSKSDFTDALRLVADSSEWGELRPIHGVLRWHFPAALRLGFHGNTVDFDWKPYPERSQEARADYDRLVVSVFHYGLQKPIITYGQNVLIGQRRAEIARRVQPTKLIPCLEIIGERVEDWGRDDINRLEVLKGIVGHHPY